MPRIQGLESKLALPKAAPRDSKSVYSPTSTYARRNGDRLNAWTVSSELFRDVVHVPRGGTTGAVARSLSEGYSGNVLELVVDASPSDEMRQQLEELVQEEFRGQSYLEQGLDIVRQLPVQLAENLDVYIDEDDGRGCFNWHVDGRSALLIVDGSSEGFYTVARRGRPGRKQLIQSGRFEMSEGLPNWVMTLLAQA